MRGDGNVVYEILKGKKDSKKNIQTLNTNIQEMEPHKSFLMQDGASIHHSEEALEWLNSHWNIDGSDLGLIK